MIGIPNHNTKCNPYNYASSNANSYSYRKSESYGGDDTISAISVAAYATPAAI